MRSARASSPTSRELHRDTEIAGAGQRVGVADAHQHRHHRTDGGGDAGGIVDDARQRLVACFHRVPGEPFEERVGQRLRHLEAVDHGGEGAVGGGVARAAFVDQVEPVAEAEDGVDLLVVEVDGVIGEAAEGVERQRRVADAGGQELRRGVERERSVADRVAADVEVAGVDHSAATSIGSVVGASGTSFASTSADEITPGRPAPGWVPAPTR